MGRLNWRFGTVSAIPAALAVLSACSGGGGVAGGGIGGDGGPGGADASAWVSGYWAGTFQLKDEDEPETTTANATFELTEEKAGNFSIVLPERANAQVTGTFRDFAGTSLMLKIAKSAVSSLGADNGTSNVDYDLIGDALKLHNERVTLRLVREQAGEGGTGGGGEGQDGPDGQSDTGLTGQWRCSDGNGYVWHVNFESPTTVAIDVHDAAGAAAPMGMNGDIATAAGTPDEARFEGVVTITKADLEKYVGLRIGVKRAGVSSLVFIRLDTEQTMSCMPG